MRTIAEANNALSMSGVEFMGRPIRVGRPADELPLGEQVTGCYCPSPFRVRSESLPAPAQHVTILHVKACCPGQGCVDGKARRERQRPARIGI